VEAPDLRQSKRRIEAERALILEEEPDFGKADSFPSGRRDVRELRHRYATRIIDALSPEDKEPNYLAAEAEISLVIAEVKKAAGLRVLIADHPDPSVYVAGELSNVLLPLCDAYSDPSLFFRDSVWRLFPRYFTKETLDPTGPRPRLAYVVWTWGARVLETPAVIAALKRASWSQRQRIESFAWKRRSRTYRDGRPQGAKDRARRKQRLGASEMSLLRDVSSGAIKVTDPICEDLVTGLQKKGYELSGVKDLPRFASKEVAAAAVRVPTP
jgi:hypothetical protein